MPDFMVVAGAKAGARTRTSLTGELGDILAIECLAVVDIMVNKSF